jgi:hypothetical protein
MKLEEFDMTHDSVNEEQQAHELIDRLPPTQLSAVVGLLEAMLDPVAQAIANAPIDDEPVTEEEEKALSESREWLKHNQAIPHEDVLTELGITEEEITPETASAMDCARASLVDRASRTKKSCASSE